MVNRQRRTPPCLLHMQRELFSHSSPHCGPHADSLRSSGSLGQLRGIACPKFVINVCECSEVERVRLRSVAPTDLPAFDDFIRSSIQVVESEREGRKVVSGSADPSGHQVLSFELDKHETLVCHVCHCRCWCQTRGDQLLCRLSFYIISFDNQTLKRLLSTGFLSKKKYIFFSNPCPILNLAFYRILLI